MATIHLTGKEPLVSNLAKLVGYEGRKFKLRTAETVDLTAGAYWSEGSRSTYTLVNLATMQSVQSPDMHPAFNKQYSRATETPLAPGLVCVQHSIFCGKDAGITIHVHPSGLDPRLLPAKTEDLTLDQRIVLYATRSLKSSYGGIKDYRFVQAFENTKISRDRWETAKSGLVSKGLLNKAGAITVDGRNAIGTVYGWPKE